MTDEYIYHTDAGHGWLEVPIAIISSIGMKPEDFLGYSSYDTASIFLEEDDDMTKFLKAYAKVYGQDAVIRIRTYKQR